MTKIKFISGALFSVALIGGLAIATPSEGDREACKAERQAMKSEIDTDGDGTVSSAEHQAHMGSIFDEVANGADTVSKEDLKAHRKAKMESSACKTRGGKKGTSDASVTRAEFLEMSEKRYNRKMERRSKRDKAE